ncbi:MAG: hybrid sensor histidine kinase/response regulator [Labilithrix sp.]|nr:hybrid sensor histidine kinase/response regulator [Labilithrix sp.]
MSIDAPAPVDSETSLILAPSNQDGPLTRKILAEHELVSAVCQDVDDLCARLERDGAGVMLVDERVFVGEAASRLRRALLQQPDWSDLPIIVFSSGPHVRARLSSEVFNALRNVTFLDRPVRVRSVLAAVRSGLRARRRQYDVRRAIALREQFLAMLGHELRNPLAAIRLAIDALKRSDASGGAKEKDIIDRQSRHLSRLVEDLLDVARVTRGKVALQRERLDLCDLVRGCYTAHAPAAQVNGVAFALQGDVTPRWIDGDRLRLEQVVGNLLTNAIKYTPAGGSVNIEIGSSGDCATVRVVDTGVGIAGAALPRIFDLFAQVDASMDRAQGGLGLGLTVAQNLVGLHGGRLEAASAGRGHGSSFTVTLPLSKEEAPSKAREPATPEVLPRRVVVVDDNQDLREMLETVLQVAGHEVTTAADGPSGLDCILSEKPDAAFVDLGLPGFDGYELARRARAAGAAATMLIAVSGYTQPEDRARAIEAGFDEHLKKPVALPQLQGALSRVRLHG